MKTNHSFPDVAEFRDAGMKGDSRIFEITQPFRYISSIGLITVPVGFLTDGLSIPRVFWNLADLSPYSSAFPAGLIHDFLYSKANRRALTRAECDRIFHEAMQDIGVGWLTRRIIYRAVRIGGRRSFKKR
jgi:hypothetical protein